METIRTLLNGETVALDVPDATALPGATAVSVLDLDGTELEVTSGRTADLDFYLSLSGTVLDRELSLRTGPVLRYGRYGRDPASGLGFAVAVGSWEVYGFTTAGTDAEALAGHLAGVEFREGEHGPVLVPRPPLRWSAYRTHTVAQVAELPGGRGLLLDVRRTRTDTLPAAEGLRVRGGLLTRSSPEERHAYAVLEAAQFVTYGIPADESDLDLVAGVLSRVRTVLR